MLTTYINYPSSFEVLRPVVRAKALEMANILIVGGYSFEMAQTIAIANARLLGCSKEGLSGIENKHVHLIPNPKGWVLVSENLLTSYFICDTKHEALIKSRSLAKNEKLKLFIHSEEGDIIDAESFIVNRPSFDKVYDETIFDKTGKKILLVDSNREVYNKNKFLSKRRHSQLITDSDNS